MRARTLLLPLSGLTTLSLLMAGCGGSGGDGPGSGTTLKTTVDFTRAGGTVGLVGRSVRLRVMDADGQSVGGQVVNGAATNVQSVSLKLNSGGERHVLAELYSGTDASGTLVGTAESTVTVASGSSSSLSLSVGEAPVAVRVTPGTASLKVGGGRAFYAEGIGASGAATFTQAGSFTYQARGNVATVSDSGIATGTAVGTGSILVTHTPSGATGSAALTVTASTVTKSKWTVLVYMNAANDLAQYSPMNVNQMEKVAGNPQVRFVVQWKQAASVSNGNNYTPTFLGTRRYLVKSDPTGPTDSNEGVKSEIVQDMGAGVDMGSATTLRDFIAWGQANYPADRYAVIIWNHGNGWRRSINDGRGVSYDDELGTSINTWQLNAGLPTAPVDILSWDSSLMQQLEVAYQIRTQAKYIVGSEESPPGEGLPYDRVFGVFRDNPDRSTAELTKAFVDGMLAVPAYSTRKITQSSIDSSKLTALGQAVDALGAVLAKGNADTVIPAVRAQTKAYSQAGARIYRDLVDVCLKLEVATDDPEIKAASALVRQRVAQAVIYEGHNANSAGSNGLSIDFSDGDNFASSVTSYRQMQFGQNTRWDEFLLRAP